MEAATASEGASSEAKEVIEAEAAIPMAIAEAFKKGQLGIMDYYKFQNIEADTDMRNSIAGSDKNKKE